MITIKCEIYDKDKKLKKWAYVKISDVEYKQLIKALKKQTSKEKSTQFYARFIKKYLGEKI